MKPTLSVLLSAGLLFAQIDVPPPIRVTTRLVQLNVIAVDKSGNPVTDLKKADFSLKDESKDQEIATFSLESATAKTAAVLLPPPGQKVFGNRPKVQVTGLTVMLFDGLNTKTEDQIRAKQQLIASLSQLGPRERISLYALGKDLRLLHDFTTDTSLLLKVLQKHGARINLEVPDANPDPSDTGDEQFDQFLDAANQTYADFVNVNRARTTLVALEAIAKQVSPIPGRKNLVWISGGFPFSIGFDSPMQSGDTRERRTFSDEAERAARLLNDAQLAVYPVDARGLRTAGLPASSPARPNRRKPDSNTGSIGPDREYDTMQIMAERTGGRAFHNTNDLAKAVVLAVNDSHVTYSIGFYPKNEVWDGKFHKLKLKVDRPGVQLRYRSGYFAFAQETVAPPPVPRTLSEAMVAPAMTTGLGLDIGLAADPAGLIGTIAVDPRELKLTEKDGRRTGALEVQVVVGIASDRKPGKQTTRMDLNFDEATYNEAMEKGFRIRTKITMPVGMNELRVGVRDVNSGTIGTLYLGLK